MAGTPNRLVRALLIVVLAAYCIYLVADLSKGTSLKILQWDFAPYYFAAKAHQQGLDPYDIDNLTEAAGTYIGYHFVYPPPTLWIFSAFTGFSYPVAAQIWLFLKLALVAALVVIWRRYFMPTRMSIFFYLMLLLAFDAAIYWDLKTGNVSIVEQFLLWTAFLFLLKKKPLGFVLFILAASTFKVTPILFLGLLPMSTIKNRWKYFAGGIAAFIIVAALFAVLYPHLANGYLSSAMLIKERADDFNYATLPFMRDIVQTTGDLTGLKIPDTFAVIAYFLAIAAIVWISVRAWRRRIASGAGIDEKLLILFACVVYALVAPRMKCYAYILLLVPGFFIMMEYSATKIHPMVFLLLILPVHNPLPQYDLIKYYRLYYLFYMTVMIWVLYVKYLRRPNADIAAGVGGEPPSTAPNAT